MKICAQYVASSLLVAGSVIASPFTYATDFVNTVDLSAQVVNADDQIETNDIIGILSDSADTTGLQIGSGKIDVTVNGIPDEDYIPTIGLKFFNSGSSSHVFGTGSTLNVTGSHKASGVALSGSTSFSGSELNITVKGTTTVNGIEGGTNSVIDLGSDSLINVSGQLTTAVALGSNGSLIADNVNITAEGSTRANGIKAAEFGTGTAIINLGNGGKITTISGSTGAGILLYGNSTVRANGLTIKTTNGYGISSSGSIAGASNVDINLGTASIISATGSSGVMLLGNAGLTSSFKANNLTIDTIGNSNHGISVSSKGINSVDLGSNSVITTSGTRSQGVWLVGSAETQFKANLLTIHTTGSEANAMGIGSGNTVIGAGSLLISDQSDGLMASSTLISGVSAPTVTVYDSKIVGYRRGVSAQQAGTVVNLYRVDAQANMEGGYGLWALNTGLINATDTSVITSADNSYGIVASGGGRVTLTGNTNVDSSSVAMFANSSASLIEGTGVMRINGDIQAKDSGLIDLSLSAGSLINGVTAQDSGGIVNLTMDNSRWNVTDDSSVNNLQLSNDSTVVFTGTNNGSLQVGNLGGNGHFVMRSSIVEDVGDLLSVTGTTAGNHQVTVVNNGSESTDGTEVLKIIQTADGNGNFALTNNVELGGYLYKLHQDGNDWELYSAGLVPPEPDPTPAPDNGTNKPNPPITSTANASANSLNVGYLMSYAETQTLMQRMGQLRSTDVDGNVWLRGYAGNFTSFGSGKLSGFDMTYNGTQLGADKQWQSANGMMYLGAALGQSNSNQDYQNGDGDMRNRHVGLYAGYLDNSGLYVDTLLKYNRMRNEINVKDTAANGVDGSASSNGISLSVETGKRFHFTPENSGFYIEPQTQLTVAWQDSSHFKNSNGLKVDLSSYTSTLGRIGGLIGYDVKKGATPVNFYFKSSYVHEFSGDTDYRLNGNKEAHSFKGDWWANGVGASVGIGKQHNLYLDLEQVNGSQFKQNQINGGYRFSF